MTAQSLRARVALAAAFGAAIIVIVTLFAAAHVIARYNARQIDQRLAMVSRVVSLDPNRVARFLSVRGGQDDLAMTVRNRTGVTSAGVEFPPLPRGYANATVDGIDFRVLTKARLRSATSISVGLPLMETRANTLVQRRRTLLAGAVAIVAAAGLGWLFGGRALRPIVRLTDWVRGHPPSGPTPRSGVREADELAEALETMHQRSASALQTAQDFALAAAHELRTPLTALRTDLDVLRMPTLGAAGRAEVVEDLLRTQNRIDQTLSALERLAVGEFTSAADLRPTDLGDICDRAAADAVRTNPALRITQDVDSNLIVNGFPPGLRLVVDNALTNAWHHGGATNIRISAHRQASGCVLLTIDDDGRGVPAVEREQVFERFVRGAGSSAGSGLGLALIAQQAALHGGRAQLGDSPLGGARLVVEIAR